VNNIRRKNTVYMLSFRMREEYKRKKERIEEEEEEDEHLC
jgi:hypothetical protein